ncbi:MAG TPA: polyprenyl synthetase family protein, partial [bacterium]|nr:polyprenyl synthetase family protein [bacterium]
LPLIHALAASPAEHAGRIVAMIEKEEMDDTEINEVVTFVRDAGGLAYAEAMARRYSDEALAILDLYAPSETRDSLIKLVQFAIAREN